MKKSLMIILLTSIFLHVNTFGDEIDRHLDDYEFNEINSVINPEEAKNKRIDIKYLAKKIITGQFDFEEILDSVKQNFFGEFKENMAHIRNILLFIILSAIIKNLSESFKTQATSEIAFYVSYIVIVLDFMSVFKVLLSTSENFLRTILDTLQSSLPLVLSLTTMSGCFYANNIFSPVIFLFADFIILVINFLLPLIFMFSVIEIINNMTGKNLIANFASLIKSFIDWFLKIIASAFMGVLAFQRLAAPLLQNVTVKTTKFVVNMIPIVGEVFSGAVDSVIAWGSVIKNGVALALVAAIFFLCSGLLIKLVIFVLIYKFLAAIIQPITDERIVKCTEALSDACILLLSCCFTAVIIFIFALMIFVSI